MGKVKNSRFKGENEKKIYVGTAPSFELVQESGLRFKAIKIRFS